LRSDPRTLAHPAPGWKVSFQTLLALKAFLDAAKKSLDAEQKPVNLKLIKGIKARDWRIGTRHFRLLKPGETIV
jgi:hypothetical protein